MKKSMKFVGDIQVYFHLIKSSCNHNFCKMKRQRSSGFSDYVLSETDTTLKMISRFTLDWNILPTDEYDICIEDKKMVFKKIESEPINQDTIQITFTTIHPSLDTWMDADQIEKETWKHIYMDIVNRFVCKNGTVRFDMDEFDSVYIKFTCASMSTEPMRYMMSKYKNIKATSIGCGNYISTCIYI